MSSSYPVDFKGTAFGDPAVVATPIRTTPAVRASAADVKALQQTRAQSRDQVTISAQARQLAAQATANKGTPSGGTGHS